MTDRTSRRATLRTAGAWAVAVAAAALVAFGAASVRTADAPTRQATDDASLAGRTVLITGSTDGLGREVALRVAARGAHVIVHGRNQERGAAVVDEITRDGRGSAKFYAADFASLDAVRAFAQAIRRDYDRIDVLVNNAGVLMRERQISADGHELQFAVNYLSGFLLTHELLPTLVASAPSRIVNVASRSQSPIDFDDVMLERPGRIAEGYGQSKLAQILFTFDLAREMDGTGVTVVVLHPATLMDTSMVRQAGMRARSSVDEGADAVMHVITGADVRSGEFYDGQVRSRAHPQAYDEAARGRLRQLSTELTGVIAP